MVAHAIALPVRFTDQGEEPTMSQKQNTTAMSIAMFRAYLVDAEAALTVPRRPRRPSAAVPRSTVKWPRARRVNGATFTRREVAA